METLLTLPQQQNVKSQDLKFKKEEKAETAGSIAMGESNTPSPLFNAETAGSIASSAAGSSSSCSGASASFCAMA